MESRSDNLRALGLSLGVHLLCVAIMFAGLWWTRESTPLSVAGEPVEAVLMSAPASWKPAAPPPKDEPEPAAPKPQPKEEKRPQQAEAPPQPQPQAPVQRPDTRETERAAQLAQQAEEKAKQEEIERKRQEQVLLDEQKREEAERKERLRQQQIAQEKELAEIRAQREEAERKRKLEEAKLQQLADLRQQQAVDAPPKPQPQPAQQLGNRGTDDSLAGRYKLAIRQAVQNNWLRPETTRPGIRCVINIVQIPGGEVIQASVSSPCNADDLTRRSIEAAVLKAQPLPYRGYESVFERSIEFTFTYNGE